jgi:hypothetical protein
MLPFRAGSAVLLLTSLHGFGAGVVAQTGIITGTMIKSVGGGAIEGGRIELIGTRYLVLTSRKGEFTFRDLEPGRYTIQASAIGFATLSAELEVKARETVAVEFQAQAETVRLADIEVKEGPRLPPDFVRRSAEGGGRYLSRTEIERRPGAATVADLLRQFPGVRLNCRTTPCSVAFTRTTRNCRPAFFLDGTETESAAVMAQPAREVDGIEVYSGLAEMPVELRGRSGACGAFAVWTRTPPDARKKPKAPGE